MHEEGDVLQGQVHVVPVDGGGVRAYEVHIRGLLQAPASRQRDMRLHHKEEDQGGLGARHVRDTRGARKGQARQEGGG